ncbi:hypothetical protein IV203_013582 [Nitzschia inconspicua]|uniref:Uncharacterized protein n=1 Tax=Nitzschia inconspicua TaxID=303405 RepID=A0A9K3Q7J7_9STRA|nr:hypothetical protein IV203_013582 [Nitzschia inconspicua]
MSVVEKDYTKLNWEDTGGKLFEFDDGHIPELCRNSDPNSQSSSLIPTWIVDYPDLFQRLPPHVRIYSSAFSEDLVDAFYKKTNDSNHPAWGDYVTIAQVKEFWGKHKDNCTCTSRQDDADISMKMSHANIDDDPLLIQLVARYLELAMKPLGDAEDDESHTSCSWIGEPGTLFTAQDLERAHGVAVWGLSAKVGSQVDYHLDYAEQIRYCSNVIVPPLLAGTLQCTRDALDGGDFQVSLKGIPHYQKHGYKAKKLGVDLENTVDNHGSDLVRIPYRFNQMICHLGNLPHSSTKINAIHGTQDRVIVGFNVFCHTAGPFVQQAPEHSDQFRRAVNLQRYISKTIKKEKGGMSLQLLKKNRALSKLLVLAKRQRIKEEFNHSLDRLLEEVPRHLPTTVAELMAHFSSRYNIQSDDVQVFLHHQIRRGQLKVINGVTGSIDGLVHPTAELATV